MLIRRTALVAAQVLMLVLAACSEETPVGGDGLSPTPTEMTGMTHEVTIAGFAFEPSGVTIDQGGTLTVTNEDSATHTFTTEDGSIDESLDPGDSVEVTVEAEGGFHCEIHPSMTGTISFA